MPSTIKIGMLQDHHNARTTTNYTQVLNRCGSTRTTVTNLDPAPTLRTLDEQRREFAQRRGLAMPLAGVVAWSIVGVAGVFLPPGPEAWVLFGATGAILYLGLLFSRFTGENFLDKQRPKNVFDGLFLRTVAMAVLVYAIAIPFFQADYTSLPLSVGILSGLMWLPFSWIIGHWVGTFHALARTALVTAGWYLFPTLRFVVVPAVIVMIYAVTIVVLEARWRRMCHAEPVAAASD
jgi:ethanolamine transporter EutH